MSNSMKTAVVLVLWLLLVSGSMIFFWYPLSTSRDQVLVQSYCSCRFFLVGLTDEPFKNRLLFHRLESQYRTRSCVIIRFMFWFNSAAQQACSWCIGATETDQSIGRQHTKAPRERSKSRKSSLLSSRSHSTPMPRTNLSVQRRSILNKPKQTINNGGRCIAIDIHSFAGTHARDYRGITFLRAISRLGKDI